VIQATRQGPGAARDRRRLFVARFFYEGNSFGPLLADRDAFERHEWTDGEEAVRLAAGTILELGALSTFRKRHPDWTLVVSRCASAIPSGPIADEVFERFMAEVIADLQSAMAAGGVDAIYLSLHGAAMTETRAHPDLDLVDAIRRCCPGAPLAATFDLHANLHPRLATLLTVAAGYRTHPHVDMRDVAQRTLERLVECAATGAGTWCCLENTALLLPSINMRTSDGPMRRLQEAAAQAEAREGVIAASIFGGFPYADADHSGASTLVFTAAAQDLDGALARQVAGQLAQALHAARDEFFIELPSPADGLARALASTSCGLIGITDAADNPYSGGAADTPGLLRALLDASPEVPCLFASFADERTVGLAKRAGLGQPFEARLGATHGNAFGDPVPVRVVPELFTPGRYRGSAGLLDGADVQLGDTVLLAVVGRPNIRIIVTSRVDPCIDLAFYRLHGIDFARERLLLVKGKNHFRAAAGTLCAEIIDVDAPGPACLDFTRLPYKHRRAHAA
jgi:microcystin degradation protein MlrC